VLILNRPAVGGFLTHCGWNSTLESQRRSQFYEMLMVELIKIGASVGSTDYASNLEARGVIDGEVVAEAVRNVMGDGEGAEAVRERARVLGEKARRAVAKDGSSYDDVGQLVNELMARRSSVQM
jgi:scopoletin glucosyltransferase